MKPKIDILLPYWGSFEMFKEAVESVLNQTEKNWRLIIIDDHYPTLDAEKYMKTVKDKRIKYLRHEKNIGITKNFNFALDLAEARYCVFMGCDDIMKPNYIEHSLKVMKNNDFYQPNVEIIDKNSEVHNPLADTVKRFIRPRKSGTYSGEKLATSLCRGNWLYFPSITWKTETVKKYRFDENYMITEDLILELSIIKNGGKIYVDNENIFQYRRHGESLSNKKETKRNIRFDEERKTYEYFESEFSEMGWNKAARSARYRLTSRMNKLLS